MPLMPALPPGTQLDVINVAFEDVGGVSEILRATSRDALTTDARW